MHFSVNLRYCKKRSVNKTKMNCAQAFLCVSLGVIANCLQMCTHYCCHLSNNKPTASKSVKWEATP